MPGIDRTQSGEGQNPGHRGLGMCRVGVPRCMAPLLAAL